MDKEQITHDLATTYAKVKLSEYQLEHREAPQIGNVSFDSSEVKFLREAYSFALKTIHDFDL